MEVFFIKILIIDNDYENIKQMKKHMLKTRNNKVFHINSIAEDIFAEIERNLIEIIFLDIRFFGAYSIKTVKSIFDKYPNMLFVYYGMISESAYIEKCMEVGGVISLLRPLKPTDIDTALATCANVKNATVEKNSKELELKELCKADTAMFKNKFLMALVQGNISNENEINRSLDFYDIQLGESYRVVSIRVDMFRKIILTLEEFEKNLLLYKMIDIVKNNIIDCKNCVFSYEFNAVVVIVSYDDSLASLVANLNKVKEEIYAKLKIQTTVGIGRKYANIKDLSKSYLEAEAALKYRYHLGYYSVIPIEHVEPNNYITYNYPKQDEYKLVCAAVIGEYEYCKMLLTNIIDSIKDFQVPQTLFSKIIMNIIISIARYCEEQFHDRDYEINNFFNFADIIKINNASDTFDYLDSFLSEFCKNVNKIRISEDLKLLESTQALINKEFMRPLSILEVAKSVNTSSEYLNKIFVEQTGNNVLDYILKVRLDKAKELMRETRKTDDVIAVAIGFTSTKYFRSIFEVNEKMSTIEYRKRYGVFYIDKTIIR